MKSTWTLDLKGEKAQRAARSLRRELGSLQGALEGVDLASARLNGTLSRMAAPVLVQRRVRAERAVAQSARATYDTHRAGHRRVSQDERTQARIRASVDRVRRAEMASDARASTRNSQRIARLNATAFRRDQADSRARLQSAQREHDFRVRGAGVRALGGGARRGRGGGGGRGAGLLDGLSTAYGAGRTTLFAGLGLAGATLGAAGAFAAMAATAAQMTLSIGESVLQMIAFREAALTTLRTMAGGDAGIASEQYSFAQRFARETPLDVQQVLALQSQVSTAGFTGGQNREVLLGAADVGAANAGDSTAASRYVRAISQIRNAGRLRAQEMNQLSEVGIGRRDLLLELGRVGNVRRNEGESEQVYLQRLQARQERGGFTGEQGVAAAQGVVRRRFNNGGDLGSFARGQGETLFGTLSNLRGAVFDLVTSINGIENAPGVRALKTVLNGIAGTLSGASSRGKELQAIVGTLINDFAMISASGISDLSETFSGMLGGAKGFLPVIRELGWAFSSNILSEFRAQIGPIGQEFRSTLGDPQTVATVRLLSRALVSLFAMSVRASGAILGLAATATIGLDRFARALSPQALMGMFGEFARPVTLGDQVRAAMGGVGDQAVLGIRQGIQRSMPGLSDEVAMMAQSIPATAQSNLAIQSPSRLMADEVGRYIPEGIAVGIDRGRGSLDRAMGDLVPMPRVAGSGAGGLGGGVNIGELVIHVGDRPDAEQAGRDAARGAIDELMRLLEAPGLAA